jgi:hypothetical protein
LKIKLLLVIILLSIFPNCPANAQSTDFDYGNIEQNIYKNKYFGIEITLPQDWVIQSREEIDNIMKTGKNLVAGDDAKMKAVIKASEVNSANLLTVFKYEIGSAVEYNPNMSMITENIKNFPGIKSGKDYLFHARKFMEQSQFKYDSLDSEFTKENINGIEFYKMNVEISYMKIKIKQVYYSSVINKFSLNFIISYISDEQKSELINSLNTLKITK